MGDYNMANWLCGLADIGYAPLSTLSQVPPVEAPLPVCLAAANYL